MCSRLTSKLGIIGTYIHHRGKMCRIVMLSCHIATACPLQRSKHQAGAAATVPATEAEAAAETVCIIYQKKFGLRPRSRLLR